MIAVDAIGWPAVLLCGAGLVIASFGFGFLAGAGWNALWSGSKDCEG